MKAKKCPYCSKRISYISGFSSRRKSEYICTRCGKESKVVINKMIFVGFALAVAVAAVATVVTACFILSRLPASV